MIAPRLSWLSSSQVICDAILWPGKFHAYRSVYQNRVNVIKRTGLSIVSTATLFSGGRFPADSMAERGTVVALLPAKSFRLAFEGSPGFRQFVCTNFSKRILDSVVLLENVAYQRVDMRLAQWLLDHARGDSTPIEISQMELARELGTAREVVGRLLKTFEGSGWVRLSRRKIRVTDRIALQALLSRDPE